MRKLIPFITVLCMILVSCGGDPIENQNYTHYNAASFNTVQSVADLQGDSSDSQNETLTAKVTTAVKSNNGTNENEGVSTGDNSASVEKSLNNNIATTQSGSAKNRNKCNGKNAVAGKPDGGQSVGADKTFGVAGKSKTSKTEAVNADEVSSHAENTTALEPLKDTDTSYITKTGSCYHRKGCRYLAKSCIEIIVGNAKEKGYRPCRVCKP